MDYAEHERQHRRLTVLRILGEAPGYSANESLLHQMVEQFGFRASRDQVRGDLTWLAEQGLVTTEETAGLLIATITQRGGDVAAGRSSVPGVKRPSPGR